MVLYYSATGNCEYVAKRIAQTIGDEAVAMKDAPEVINIKIGESLAFVIPTYYWGLPKYVDDFMENVKFEGVMPVRSFIVSTYGSTSGASIALMEMHMFNIKMPTDAVYTLKMPDDWTPKFDMSDEQAVQRQVQEADARLEELLEKIQKRSKGDFATDRKPVFMALIAQMLYGSARKTKHLHVSSSCTGCGTCAEGCWEQAIIMENNRPVFQKDLCSMCLKCLHRCPVFAIDYKNKTQQHGQYVHPKSK